MDDLRIVNCALSEIEMKAISIFDNVNFYLFSTELINRKKVKLVVDQWNDISNEHNKLVKIRINVLTQ